MNVPTAVRCVLAAGIAWSFSALSHGTELEPGRIGNPAGNQMFQRILYNPVQDDYLIFYSDGRALVAHLSTDGDFTNQVELSTAQGVTHVVAAYNPGDQTFLVVYRLGSPANIFGRYIDTNGNPIGNAFFIGTGGGPGVAFSPSSGRYVVTWTQLSGAGSVRIRVIEWAALLKEHIRKRHFEALILGWGIGVDPDQFVVWHSSQQAPEQLNHIGYANPEVDALLERGRASCRQEERVATYHRLQQVLAEDQPLVFLYFRDALQAVSSRVHGIEPGANGIRYNLPEWFVPRQLHRYTAG